ncbi:2-keto-4-pentenoate hydratase/2-oxohepta-3-ene-1,7-dioic acid hydratase in catechol pathway [Nocardia tenerifensis]|uniref:2-keto-4-pentenoate hydratase/2-oxohepta-3-ene-1,7-dioic acid hydratase in catechol pathway n=1 Tax=Nocardia tenerifensis TaxID=228006 RepID=A0A318JTA5_9NOCA|nr:fumarylacetoacetate hydrolase family protein [Nocardia tenerifensis]PXX58335.1 2-keto-4-pentenoate hydratase/2-oxohepta-3-ene-1,7-dioic acid hydratase in catechol pathway [Nocardia tenerifensis]
MKLQRIGAAGAERPIVVDGGHAYDLRSLTADIDGDFLAADGIAAVATALGAGRLSRIEVSGERVGAPIARPHAVWCVGMNYAAHAAESGSAPPSTPVVFFKTPNTVIGPYDDVLIPPGSTKTDWEVELAVVIGRRARYLDSVESAMEHIAGYTISNDVSERAFQLEQSGGQWSKGKCCETFNPLGPALVPRDRLDAGNLRLRSFVNGEPRQDSSTADLIFDVGYLVWHLSQYAVLEPGDIVNTGTPAGVALSGRFPYLRDGDVVEVEVEGIGRARQRCLAAARETSPLRA